MFPRLIFIAWSLLAITGYSVNAETKVPHNLNSSLETSINNQKNINITAESKGNSKTQRISVGSGTVNQNYMTLTPTQEVNQLGNPLYELRLFAKGELVASFKTVSGRAYTQAKERHRSGTEAPLPDGRYKVATKTTRGTIAEAGSQFLPIQPMFKTGRTALGIHIDPSFNKNNGEDGTSGCIGMTTSEQLSQLLDYVRTYKPKFLEVRIKA
jgi:L,D-transpeptidase catalytic domain